MTIRSTVNQGIMSDAKYFEVPVAPQTGQGRLGETYELVSTDSGNQEMRDIDARNLTGQSAIPSNRHNGPVE